jgi:hypothetical protein
MSKQPYTYTVLRYVHDTGTGEFANVGVVLNAPSAGYADEKTKSESRNDEEVGIPYSGTFH